MSEVYVDESGNVVTPPCRSGCTTKDHHSYAECLRAANLQIGNLK